MGAVGDGARGETRVVRHRRFPARRRVAEVFSISGKSVRVPVCLGPTSLLVEIARMLSFRVAPTSDGYLSRRRRRRRVELAIGQV